MIPTGYFQSAFNFSATTSCDGLSVRRVGNTEDPNFVTAQAAVAIADGKRQMMASRSNDCGVCAPDTAFDPSGETAMPAILPLWPLKEHWLKGLSNACASKDDHSQLKASIVCANLELRPNRNRVSRRSGASKAVAGFIVAVAIHLLRASRIFSSYSFASFTNRPRSSGLREG